MNKIKNWFEKNEEIISDTLMIIGSVCSVAAVFFVTGHLEGVNKGIKAGYSLGYNQGVSDGKNEVLRDLISQNLHTS